jgi:nucleoside 2-deoxyribosyltransferase
VYELGYMSARGKFCLGYSNDRTVYADRVRRFTKITERNGRLADADGLTVEDFGHNDNLMIIHALDLYGATLVLPRETPTDIWHDLTAFEVCVGMASARFTSAS